MTSRVSVASFNVGTTSKVIVPTAQPQDDNYTDLRHTTSISPAQPSDIHLQAIRNTLSHPLSTSQDKMAPKRKSASTSDLINNLTDERTTKRSRPDTTTKTPSIAQAQINFIDASSLPSPSEAQTDEEGNVYWSLSKARRVTINEYRGKQMVSIREYYEKDGKWLPGKKGITLTVEQWSALMGVVPGVHGYLRGKGEEVVKVDYDRAGGAEDEEEEEKEEEEDGDESTASEKDGVAVKKNYEGTDDEEE